MGAVMCLSRGIQAISVVASGFPSEEMVTRYDATRDDAEVRGWLKDDESC